MSSNFYCSVLSLWLVMFHIHIWEIFNSIILLIISLRVCCLYIYALFFNVDSASYNLTVHVNWVQEFSCRLYGIFYVRISSFASRDKLTPFFPVFIPSLSLSCLISIAKTFSTLSNKRAVSGHPCLIPDLEE